MPGTLPRHLSGRCGRFHSIGATAIACHDMLRARDLDVGSEDALEHVQLGGAQRATRRGSVPYGTVMLDQQEVVAIWTNLCQISLVRSDVGEPLDTFTQACGAAEHSLVRGHLPIGSCADHLVERRIAQGRAQRADEVDAQLTVPIGERLCGARRELPMHRRTPTSGWFRHRTSDHPGCFERVEVLAQRRVRKTELACKIGRGSRLHALQALDDPSLGVGELCHVTNSTAGRPISEGAPCIMSDARDPGRL